MGGLRGLCAPACARTWAEAHRPRRPPSGCSRNSISRITGTARTVRTAPAVPRVLAEEEPHPGGNGGWRLTRQILLVSYVNLLVRTRRPCGPYPGV